jgi:hypothetical protein
MAIEPTKTPEELAAEKTAADTEAIKTNADGIDQFLGEILKKETPDEKAAKAKAEAVASKAKEGEKSELQRKADLAKERKEKAKQEREAKAKEIASKPIDADAIAEAAARGTVSALEKSREEAARKAAEEAEKGKGDQYAHLDEDQKADLPILQQMEKANPTKYKGLADKYAKSVKALAEYREAWEKANPDKEFNGEDDEHNEFFSKNEVGWKDRDYAEAIADLKLEKMQANLKQENEKAIGELKGKERARELEPLAVTEAKSKARELFKSLGGDFENVVDENGLVNGEAVKKLHAEDDRSGMAFAAATDLEQMCAENYRLHNGLKPFDANNPLHSRLLNHALESEKAMLDLPPQDQIDDKGRQFAPNADYWKMTKAQRERHWTFNMTDLNTLLAADVATNLKNQITAREKEMSAWAEKRGYKRAAGEGEPERKNGAEHHEEKPEIEEVEQVEKPRAVTSIPDSQVAQYRTAKLTGKQNGVSRFFSDF